MSDHTSPAVLIVGPSHVESGALIDDELNLVSGGATSRTRRALEAAALRMDDDAIYAFIDGFLRTAPV